MSTQLQSPHSTMGSNTHTQEGKHMSTHFAGLDPTDRTFDVAPFLKVVNDGPESLAQHLEQAHRLLLEFFLAEGFDSVFAQNILYTLSQLRNAIVKGATGFDLEIRNQGLSF